MVNGVTNVNSAASQVGFDSNAYGVDNSKKVADAAKDVAQKAEETGAERAKSVETEAAVYEKSGVQKKASQPANPELIEKLKADAEQRNAQLRGIVERLILKQGGTLLNSEGLASVFRHLEVDEETRAQAQKDIADDGYWGVEATSDRILDFAKAMAGDDLEMAKSMLEAVKKGFNEAGKEWGEDLPDISQKTMKATYDKMNAWIDSLGGNKESSVAVQDKTVQNKPVEDKPVQDKA